MEELTFTNKPYGNLRVEKYSDTGELLECVTIQIKNLETGETQSGQTGPDGSIEFTELAPGGYEVREISGIPGWQADTETVKTATVYPVRPPRPILSTRSCPDCGSPSMTGRARNR